MELQQLTEQMLLAVTSEPFLHPAECAGAA